MIINVFSFSGDSKPSHSLSDAEIGPWSVKKRFGKLRINEERRNSEADNNKQRQLLPPRPPKPAHMLPENPGHNYLNLDGATESSKPTTPATPAGVITDETYDFPRSHQPQGSGGGQMSSTSSVDRLARQHCYSNAAPTTVDSVFSYDFHDEEPSSPRSDSSTTATYSNLPSPLVKDSSSSSSVPTNATKAPPPVVYRELKPGRKTSDTASIISNEPSPGFTTVLDNSVSSSTEHSPAEPPSINRKLKPSQPNKSPLEGKFCRFSSILERKV